MNRTERLAQYISDFFAERWENIDFFYWSSHKNRRSGIYTLEKGTLLMDFVIGIHGYIEEKLLHPKLIPQKFVTAERLFVFLNEFKTYLNENQYLLDLNNTGEDTDYIITKIQEFKNDLIDMINYCRQVYDTEDDRIPYQDLRYYLISRNIPEFIRIMKSILSSVSYAITKSKEGYYHSNIHLILKLLGFEILSEELTNNGRIDAVIRFSDIIYITEFKFSDKEDTSHAAFGQIITKNYAQKFFVEHKEIIGIGISFSENERNINGYTYEKLN